MLPNQEGKSRLADRPTAVWQPPALDARTRRLDDEALYPVGMEVYNGGIFTRLFQDNLAAGKREGLANSISHQVQYSVWKRCRFQRIAGGAHWIGFQKI